MTGLPLLFKQRALRTALAPAVRADHVGGGGEGHPCKLRGHRQLQLQVESNNTQMATIIPSYQFSISFNDLNEIEQQNHPKTQCV